MKCIVLAAGYATRLYPLTRDFPKPLLPVGEKTILDWLTDDIDTAGAVDEYAVVTNHRFAGHFEKWAAGKRLNAPVRVLDDGTADNETRLGAVRDIAFAVETRGYDDDLLVAAGDNVLDFSLTRFIAYAQGKKASCIMRYEEPSPEKLRKCGVAQIGENDRVLSMVEKPAQPVSRWCVPPFYVYARRDAPLIARGINEGCPVDAPGSFAAWLCARAPLYAMEMPGSRYDVGNLESYERVRTRYKGTGGAMT